MVLGRLETISSIREHATIGPGAPGRKSQGLLREKAIIEKYGLAFPEFVSITPAFFNRFLHESGARLAPSNNEAFNRVMEHNFTKAEQDEIAAAALSFEPSLAGRAIMVRSDEWDGGSGIWESKAASALAGEDKLFVARVLEAAKRAIASGFSHAAAQFRRKNSIRNSFGIMLMPFYGANVIAEGRNLVVPAIAANFMSKNGKPVLAQFGSGVDGANKRYNAFMGGYYFGEMDEETMDLLGKFLVGTYETTSSKLDVATSKILTYEQQLKCTEYAWTAGRRINLVTQRFADLVSNKGSRYYEVIRDSWTDSNWVVVQAARPKIEDVPENVSHKDLLGVTRAVVGSAVADAKGILYVESGWQTDRLKTCFEYDSKNKGYLLIVDAPSINTLGEKHLEILERLENKAAVVFSVDEICNTLASHLNGRLRLLGVPILAIEGKRQAMQRLDKNGEYVLYANEWAEKLEKRGFLATK